MSEIYGKLGSEKLSEENEICRKIVSEIMGFGINQRQLKYVIYLLSLNIEEVDSMRELVGLTKEIFPEVFVSSQEGS